MKIRNWCRKLSVTLVAGGLLMPCAAQAADLGTNLIQNPGFELLNGSIGVNSGVGVLNWNDGLTTGFAYNYGQDYDFGGPLAGGGIYYFTSNQSGGSGTNVTAPATVMQIIDVSSGSAAIAISNGSATYNLSAFFTTYVTPAGVVDGDIGNIELRFVDSSNVGISAVTLSDPNPFAGWKQASTSGSVPAGTASLYVSLYGTPVTFGPDGYLDNLDLRLDGVVPEPGTGLLAGFGVAAAGWFRRIRNRSKS